MAFFPGQLG